MLIFKKGEEHAIVIVIVQQNPLTKPLCTKSEKKEVTFLNNPGIYELWDTVNDKSYYGESSCLMHRLDLHRQELERGFHSNAGLNTAMQNGISIADIQFIVLDCGPEWALLDHRKVRENAYIERNGDTNRCYSTNFDGGKSAPPKRIIMRPFMAYNTRYQSTRAAVKGEAEKGRPLY
uniref:Putative GIY YIG homing endonuclease n=1 Tax=Chloromonas perforata TaxID=51730 RepID=A0A0S2LPW7_9CHLO|nr:putative GIY YIG homing endonuclease [Chloromonas perforata]